MWLLTLTLTLILIILQIILNPKTSSNSNSMVVPFCLHCTLYYHVLSRPPPICWTFCALHILRMLGVHRLLCVKSERQLYHCQGPNKLVTLNFYFLSNLFVLFLYFLLKWPSAAYLGGQENATRVKQSRYDFLCIGSHSLP